jgi:hypothetical protein
MHVLHVSAGGLNHTQLFLQKPQGGK